MNVNDRTVVHFKTHDVHTILVVYIQCGLMHEIPPCPSLKKTYKPPVSSGLI